jgi:hypothetical protein
MDFLILLALHMDANRNFQTSYVQPGNTRVTDFLGDPNWRERWAKAEEEREVPVRFLAEQYSLAMADLSYARTPVDKMVLIRSDKRNLPLYYLAFFSKNPRGNEFWREVRRYSDPQFLLDI